MSAGEYRIDARTQCWLRGLYHDFDQGIGHLIMGERSCTDMMGCIEIFMAIDPRVAAIVTWQKRKAGLVRDTIYQYHGGQWHAILEGRFSLVVPPPPGYVEVGPDAA